jgi:hypothetical protein
LILTAIDALLFSEAVPVLTSGLGLVYALSSGTECERRVDFLSLDINALQSIDSLPCEACNLVFLYPLHSFQLDLAENER